MTTPPVLTREWFESARDGAARTIAAMRGNSLGSSGISITPDAMFELCDLAIHALDADAEIKALTKERDELKRVNGVLDKALDASNEAFLVPPTGSPAESFSEWWSDRSENGGATPCPHGAAPSRGQCPRCTSTFIVRLCEREREKLEKELHQARARTTDRREELRWLYEKYGARGKRLEAAEAEHSAMKRSRDEWHEAWVSLNTDRGLIATQLCGNPGASTQAKLSLIETLHASHIKLHATAAGGTITEDTRAFAKSDGPHYIVETSQTGDDSLGTSAHGYFKNRSQAIECAMSLRHYEYVRVRIEGTTECVYQLRSKGGEGVAPKADEPAGHPLTAQQRADGLLWADTHKGRGELWLARGEEDGGAVIIKASNAWEAVDGVRRAIAAEITAAEHAAKLALFDELIESAHGEAGPHAERWLRSRRNELAQRGAT